MFGKKLFARMDAKAKSVLGLYTTADIQDAVVEQHTEFLYLREKLDKRAEEKLMEDPTVEVVYNWVDVDAKNRRNKDNLHVLKNQIEILKRSTSKIKELTNTTISYQAALKQAIADYVNKNSDYVTNGIITQLNRYLKENKFRAFELVLDPVTKKRIEKIDNYNDIVNICDQIEVIKCQIEYSEEWILAHKSRDIVNSRKK